MLYRCYAKINLTLEVLRRRDDGFHDLASVVHTISLADDLSLEANDDLLTRVEGLEPVLDDNLVDRAARLLASTARVRAGARLTVVKRIPAAAGLGGGSSDAATTLVGLNTLWQTRLGYHALPPLALQLGSDVPFFLRGGAALMSGRGDQLRRLPPVQGQWLVLITPEISLADKTPTLYGALRAADFSDGAASMALADGLQRSESIDAAALVNAFERPAREVFPGLDNLWRKAEQRCRRRFCLSGAGPSLFSLVESRVEAQRLRRVLEAEGLPVHAVRTVKHARVAARFSTRAPIEYA